MLHGYPHHDVAVHVLHGSDVESATVVGLHC